MAKTIIVRSTMKKLLKLCPYTHVFETVKKRNLPENSVKTIRTGSIIALLGMFCPLFWIPFLSGTPLDDLWFDVAHSSIFVCIGLGMMVYGFFKKNL